MRSAVCSMLRLILPLTALVIAGCGFVDGAGSNNPPSVSAADINANERELVILKSAVTDDFENIVSYEWTQETGDSLKVALDSADAATASFTAPALPADATLSFLITVTDNFQATATDTVSVRIKAINDPPVAAADNPAPVVEGGTLALDLVANDNDDNDANNQPLKAIPTTMPANGQLVLDAGGAITAYVHNGSETLGDSFSYTANDGTNDSNPVTVDITVNPVNDAPLATDDAYRLDEGASRSVGSVNGVLGNDNDVEGDPLTATLTKPPKNGTLRLKPDGSFTYTHDGSETIKDNFTYVAEDNGDSTPAKVVIRVNPVNDPPVAVNDVVATLANQGVAISVLLNDTDAEGNDTIQPASVLIVTPPLTGIAFPLADGRVVYIPNALTGPVETFTYTIADADGAVSAPATITVSVAAVVAPFSATGCAVVSQETSLQGNLGNKDTSTSLAFEIATGEPSPEKGTVSINPDGSFEYQPFATGGRGADSFQFEVQKGDEPIASGAFDIIVKPRIMALGDVVVQNPDTTPTPYWQLLFESLRDEGYAVALLPATQDNDGTAYSAAEVAFGRAGEGGMQTWLDQSPADFVLLPLGNAATGNVDGSPEEIVSILGEIETWEDSGGGNPVTVIIAHDRSEQAQTTYGDVQAMIQTRADDDIVLIDSLAATNAAPAPATWHKSVAPLLARCPSE